jgi:cobalt-zinc-cadmium efflux system protein
VTLSRPKRLAVVLGLNLALVVGLITVGSSAHSLGVFAEGIDCLADAAAIGVSLAAIWMSGRPPNRNGQNRHRSRATTIAALVNAGWLLILSVLVIAGAIDRLVIGSRDVRGLPVLIASAIAALTMLCGALILGGDVADAEDDGVALNVRAVLLDTVADTATATGVAITGGVILGTHGLYWLDPTVALAIATVIAFHAVRLLRSVVERLRAR